MTETHRYSLWQLDGEAPTRVGGYDSLHDALALVPGLAASERAAMVVNHNGVDGVRLCYESPAARAHPDHDAAISALAANFGVTVAELVGRPELQDLEQAPEVVTSEPAPALEL